jgi:hypothetical protein
VVFWVMIICVFRGFGKNVLPLFSRLLSSGSDVFCRDWEERGQRQRLSEVQKIPEVSVATHKPV